MDRAHKSGGGVWPPCAWNTPTTPGVDRNMSGRRAGESSAGRRQVAAEVERLGGLLLPDETAAREEIRRAKASRARHVRNQGKCGHAVPTGKL